MHRTLQLTGQSCDADTSQYAQIEKELLAIVLACKRFDTYIYGRDAVTVTTDHKPMESIVHKALNAAPQRLQRMLLHLKRYSLNVHYKKRKEMFLVDTLSTPVQKLEEITTSTQFQSVKLEGTR